jgi:hypothetical protein
MQKDTKENGGEKMYASSGVRNRDPSLREIQNREVTGAVLYLLHVSNQMNPVLGGHSICIQNTIND